ncbi:RNA 2',3'-cyclic phosphodiesterase [Deinococcus petrolearius]|uniref:RNA 2',3'-cyclic phosphodiesterase n=1 Tax=Deinococcus petrolearius TaxID=1751295 RepID=A0ABW1DI45_9DEIO
MKVRTGPGKPAASKAAPGKSGAAEPAKSAVGPAVASRPRPARPSGPAQPENRPHTPSTLRLFYALKVPTGVAAPLAEAQRQLKGNWRSVRADQMHVTLAYLPAVPPARLGDLGALGLRLMGERSPMDVRLRGTGYFPNEGSPRVWFVKVEADGLDELAAELRAGIQELGLETDDLNFKAHITLARKKGPAPRVPPLTFDLGWQASGAALMRSILRKTGPIYETESTFRFQGRRVAAPPGALTDPTDDIPGQEAHQETP